MFDPLRLAFGTLTALPVKPPSSLAAPVPGRAMLLAPLAGLVPGLGAATVALLFLQQGISTPVVAVLVVGLFALTTRGLHLDGLADTADGLAASYQRERALQVMRRGDTGPAGMAAVVLTLLLQTALLAQVLTVTGDHGQAGSTLAATGWPRTALIIPAVAMAGRLTIGVLCLRGVPAARPEGLGATVAGTVSPGPLLLVVAVVVAACSACGRFAGFSWWAGPVAVLLAVVVAGLLTHRAVQRFGGITGDVLGAAVEFGTAAALLGFAVVR